MIKMSKYTFGYVRFAGIEWEIEVDTKKSNASKSYYIMDYAQCKLIIGDESDGVPFKHDRLVEHTLRVIASTILTMNGDSDDYVCDRFLYPFSAFLYQFLVTDTFNGTEGGFVLGAVSYDVITDNQYSYHRNVNGEHDYSASQITLNGQDDETGSARHPDYVRFVYIHEVTHALLVISGMCKHEEKFVKTFGCFLYDALATLRVKNGSDFIPMWPKR